MLILLAVCHTFILSLVTEFNRFPELFKIGYFQDFTVKFEDFPGLTGSVRTLWY